MVVLWYRAGMFLWFEPRGLLGQGFGVQGL